MTIKNIAEKVARVLPIGSLLVYSDNQFIKPREERDSGIKYRCKSLGHISYAVAFSTYIFLGSITGAWAPQQYKQAFEKVKTKAMQPNKLNQKLFGENGYADKDGDGTISPEERFEVYKKIGLEHTIKFPDLYLKDLERAVKSYEVDNQ